jgi:hypothetical protein
MSSEAEVVPHFGSEGEKRLHEARADDSSDIISVSLCDLPWSYRISHFPLSTQRKKMKRKIINNNNGSSYVAHFTNVPKKRKGNGKKRRELEKGRKKEKNFKIPENSSHPCWGYCWLVVVTVSL